MWERHAFVIAAGEVLEHARTLTSWTQRHALPLVVFPSDRAAAMQAHVLPISLVLLFQSELSADALRTFCLLAPDAPLLQVSARRMDHDDVRWVQSSDPDGFEVEATRLLQRERRFAKPLQLGPLKVDPDRGSVWSGSKEIALPRAQFRLLSLLVREPGRVFDRTTLCAAVLGTHGSPRRIDWHVARLRAALGPLGRCIQTWPTGYSITAPDHIVSTSRRSATHAT